MHTTAPVTPKTAAAPVIPGAKKPAAGSPGSYQGVVITPGNDKSIAAQIAAIDAARAKTQENAATIVDEQKSGNGKITNSSRSVRNNENKTKTDVQKFNEAKEREKIEGASSLQYIDDYMSQLEGRRSAELSGINTDYDEQGNKLEGQQANETGATTNTLARIGGYLGPSASATGAMINLSQEHKAEVSSLEAKRQSALLAANNAIDDRKFDIAKLRVQEVKDIEQEIQRRKEKFFDNQITLSRESRDQDEFVREKYKDQLETLAFANPEDIDEDSLKAIDDYYGVPGFAQKYIDVSKIAAEAKTEKAQLENRKAVLDLLKDIPAGQTVAFPDGTEYTGMGSAGDISTTLQVDDSGRGHIVAYNKLTGATSITSVGQVGKTKSSGSSGGGKVNPTTKDNVVAMAQMRLEESKATDGTYDPDTYLRERGLIKEAYPALIPYVDSLFLNKSNEFFSADAIVRLRQKGVFYGDVPLVSSEETIVNNNNNEESSDDMN